MSDEITKVFYDKYRAGFEMLAQQMQAITEGTVKVLPDVTGERQRIDQIGATRLEKKQARHADVPTVAVPKANRWLTTEQLQARDFIDKADKLKVFNDPTNDMTEAFLMAGRRSQDKVTVDAALGTAIAGKTGTTSVPLPAGQVIAAGGTGFTLVKLQDAVKRLRKAHAISIGDEIHAFYTSEQEEEFINTTEVKSSDFNRNKVLVEGSVGSFYSVNFHLIEDISDDAQGRMLPKSGTTRSCIVWAKSKIRYGELMPLRPFLDWLPEKQNWQVGATFEPGAVRTQDTGVVQLDVLEA